MRICQHVALVSLIGLVGCISQPPKPIEDSLVRSAEFSKVNPSAIAMLKIEDRTGGSELAPLLEPMRTAMHRELISRSYAPYSPLYSDPRFKVAIRNATTGDQSSLDESFLSSLAGQAGEEAILAVQFSHWDTSNLLVNNRVLFAARVMLFGSADKVVLWSGELRGEVRAGGNRPAPRDPKKRAQAAGDEAIRQLISRLPRWQS